MIRCMTLPAPLLLMFSSWSNTVILIRGGYKILEEKGNRVPRCLASGSPRAYLPVIAPQVLSHSVGTIATFTISAWCYVINPVSDMPSLSSLRSSSNCEWLVVERARRKINETTFDVRAQKRLKTELKLLRSTSGDFLNIKTRIAYD